MTLTTVIDVGNFSTKYVYQEKEEIKCGAFTSVLAEYVPMEEYEGYQRVEYNGLDFYAGEKTYAFYHGHPEKMYFGNVRKGHHEAQIRLVYALYNIFKETGQKSFNLILTCPYESMEKDKKYFVKNFEGTRVARIDGEDFEFDVNKIIMAAEGLGAMNFTKSLNCVVVDAGSKTLNILHFINGHISKKDSHTINGGTIDNTTQQLAITFAKICNTVDYEYPIVTTGGKADEMKEALEKIGYSDVMAAELKGYPSYFINSVGLLLKYGKKFEVMFVS